MNIQVLFFGATADIAGRRSNEINLPAETMAKTAFDQILAEYPLLAARTLHFSVNQEFANGEEILKDGDEIAIFTAVSGG